MIIRPRQVLKIIVHAPIFVRILISDSFLQIISISSDVIPIWSPSGWRHVNTFIDVSDSVGALNKLYHVIVTRQRQIDDTSIEPLSVFAPGTTKHVRETPCQEKKTSCNMNSNVG